MYPRSVLLALLAALTPGCQSVDGGNGTPGVWEVHAGAAIPGVVFIPRFRPTDAPGMTCPR